MPRSPARLELTTKQRNALETWAIGSDPELAQRASILLQGDGATQWLVTQGFDARTAATLASRWRGRFLKNGLEGLLDGRSGRRAPRVFEKKVAAGSKVCNGPGCNGKERPASDFAQRRIAGRVGLESWCRACHAIYDRERS